MQSEPCICTPPGPDGRMGRRGASSQVRLPTYAFTPGPPNTPEGHPRTEIHQL